MEWFSHSLIISKRMETSGSGPSWDDGHNVDSITLVEADNLGTATFAEVSAMDVKWAALVPPTRSPHLLSGFSRSKTRGKLISQKN